MMKDTTKNNELIELQFQGIDIKFPRHVATFQIRIYCEASGHRYLAGETEFVAATQHPAFKKVVRLEYLPNCKQKLEIQCADSANLSLSTLGDTSTFLGEIIGAEDGLNLSLITSPDLVIGHLNIQYRTVIDDKSSYHIGFNCLNVKNLEYFSKSDPYVRMFRPSDIHITAISKDDIPSGGWVLLHETEFYRHDLNPKFKPFAISKWNICKSNLDALIKFEIWDHSKIGLHRKIATAFTSVNRILNETDKFLNTFNEKDKYGGTICFYLFEEKKFFMFDQYINAGVQLRLVFAVDCSGSTKEMHKIEAGGKADLFETAIREVSSVLISKEKTNRFGFLGFGAKIKGCKHPTFAFNHEKSQNNLSVSSVEEATDLYRSVYPKIEPVEPTNLSAVIERLHIMMKHQDKRNYKIYTLLVILTDGDVSDQQATVDKIVECSVYPLSVVLIGVGQNNFEFLEYLESAVRTNNATEDDKKKKKDKEKKNSKKRLMRLRSSQGKDAFRRIVRFVYYQNYIGKHKELEEAILRDVPRQMTEFYNLMKFDPSPKSSEKEEYSLTKSTV